MGKRELQPVAWPFSCARSLCLWNDIHILIMFTIIGYYWLSDRSDGGSRDGGGNDRFIYFVEIIYGRPVFAYNLYSVLSLIMQRKHSHRHNTHTHIATSIEDDKHFQLKSKTCMHTWLRENVLLFQSMNK